MVAIDIGECLIGTHNCSQECSELPGEFECHCFPGYELQEDEVTCEGNNVFLFLFSSLFAL